MQQKKKQMYLIEVHIGGPPQICGASDDLRRAIDWAVKTAAGTLSQYDKERIGKALDQGSLDARIVFITTRSEHQCSLIIVSPAEAV